MRSCIPTFFVCRKCTALHCLWICGLDQDRLFGRACLHWDVIQWLEWIVELLDHAWVVLAWLSYIASQSGFLLLSSFFLIYDPVLCLLSSYVRHFAWLAKDFRLSVPPAPFTAGSVRWSILQAFVRFDVVELGLSEGM